MKKFTLGLIVGIALTLIFFTILSISDIYYSYYPKVGVIELNGEISYSPSLFTETINPDDVFSLIKQAEDDNSIKSVLFKINSPGGSVVASREIALRIKEMKKPTICWLADVAASGAYWIASSCDKIVSDPLTITGSIGVEASYLQFEKTFEKYGVEYERIVSGESKDIGSPYRNLTEEERKKLEKIVNDTLQYFLQDIISSRNLTQAQVNEIVSGDIFLGKDALKLGLIDSLGSYQDTKKLAANLSGVKNPMFITLSKGELSLIELLGKLI